MAAAHPVRPTRVEIDLDACCANAAWVRGVAATELFAVIKADAYGHGAVPIANALAKSGAVAGFAVSLVEEGCALRDAGVSAPILVMGPALGGGHEELVARDLLALVTQRSDLDALAALGRKRGRPVAHHLKVDTGMGRLGIHPRDVADIVSATLGDPGLCLRGIATHFACADTDDPADPTCMTLRQLGELDAAVATARRCGATIEVVHAANSAAALRFPAARLDLVRCGLALYGNGGGDGLRPVMKLFTEIAQVRVVEAGATVSYGALWRAAKRSRIAVLPIGYADGYPRSLTGKAAVLVAGQRGPVVGAISMDITLVDVTALGDAACVGAPVVLLGSQGKEHIAVAEFATWAQLLEYEVTCGISKRVPRTYS